MYFLIQTCIENEFLLFLKRWYFLILQKYIEVSILENEFLILEIHYFIKKEKTDYYFLGVSRYRKNVLRYIAIFFSLYSDILRYVDFIIFSEISN